MVTELVTEWMMSEWVCMLYFVVYSVRVWEHYNSIYLSKTCLPLTQGLQSEYVLSHNALPALSDNPRPVFSVKIQKHTYDFLLLLLLFSYPLQEIWVILPGQGYSSFKNRAIHSLKQCMQFSRVPKQKYRCQSLGFVICTLMLMRAVAHKGCMDRVCTQSLLWEKNPFSSNVILCGWLGSKHQLIAAPGNRTCLSVVPVRHPTNWATPTHPPPPRTPRMFVF